MLVLTKAFQPEGVCHEISITALHYFFFFLKSLVSKTLKHEAAQELWYFYFILFFLHHLLLSNISLSFLYTMGFSFVNDNAVFDSVCRACYFMLR